MSASTCTPSTGPGGLPCWRVANDLAEAEVFANGAHVTHYQPRGAEHPVLWLSEHSRWRAGAPIRGGIPLCWPWFAAYGPADGPAHGIARTATWCYRGHSDLASGATRLDFELADDRESRRWIAQGFHLQLGVTVGRSLEVRLRMRNRGDQVLRWTGALHSYFAVSDVRAIAVDGFEGATYRDRLREDREFVQHGAITFTGETDRIYFGDGPAAFIHDPGWARRIRIAGRGSGSTVVWNPWVAKSARMSDFGDDEWPGMVCVETARAPGDEGHLAPGAVAELGVDIALD